jgi:hypothetical protein
VALTPDEQAQLDALTSKANEPDDSSDFEIEIYNDKGSGARVPYHKGRSFLQREFGIDLDPEPGKDPADDKDQGKGGKQAGKGSGPKQGDQQDPQGQRIGLFQSRQRPA